MTSFYDDFNNGQQFALLRRFASSNQAIHSELADTFFSENYQSKNPKTYAALKDLITAFVQIKHIEGVKLSQIDQNKKQALLKKYLVQGQQLAVLALIANGAYLTHEMIEIINAPNFAQQNPLTHKAVKPFVKWWLQPLEVNSGSAIEDEQQQQDHLERNLIDLRNYNAGDGAFTNDESLTHAQIVALKNKYQDNPALRSAFSIVEGLDIANRNDIMFLCNFLNQEPSRISAQDVIDAISADMIKLNKIHANEENRMNLPVDDCFNQMTNQGGVLQKAKRILQKHPELVNGILNNEKFAEYRNKDLGGLKAALAYAAKLKGADENLFKHLKGFYQANVPNGNNYSAQLMFGKKLYVPANGYVLGGDQISANDAVFDQHEHDLNSVLTDCSGLLTNVIRDLRPDLTWLNNNRLQSWDLEKAHDAKFMNRNDVYNQQGPIQPDGSRRKNLTADEKSRLQRWKNNNPTHFNTVDRAFETVKNRSDIRPGDFIVYRQRKNGSAVSSDTGHVAMVVEPKGGNKAILLEYTRSGGRDGLGFTNRPICYGAYGNTKWETRVLRPKLN